MSEHTLEFWFMNEILPLEHMLVRFLQRNWRDKSEVADLRQETYLRVYEAARRERPFQPKPFLFQIARNLMIDRLRQKNVVSIDTIADFEALNISGEEPTPEQHVVARQQIRQVQAALDDLPQRSREIVMLRKIYGLSQREVAQRLGIAEDTVEREVANSVRLLAHAICSRRGQAVADSRRYLAKLESKIR
jgi:RNA polymerase sigma factor (sigma-70 family)